MFSRCSLSPLTLAFRAAPALSSGEMPASTSAAAATPAENEPRNTGLLTLNLAQALTAPAKAQARVSNVEAQGANVSDAAQRLIYGLSDMIDPTRNLVLVKPTATKAGGKEPQLADEATRVVTTKLFRSIPTTGLPPNLNLNEWRFQAVLSNVLRDVPEGQSPYTSKIFSDHYHAPLPPRNVLPHVLVHSALIKV